MAPDPVKVGDGAVPRGITVVKPGTLLASILRTSRAFDGQLRWEPEPVPPEARHQAKQAIDALRARWEEIRDEASRYDCFSHSDLYQFEQSLHAWIGAYYELSRERGYAAAHPFPSVEGFESEATQRVNLILRQMLEELRRQEQKLMSEAAAIERRLAVVRMGKETPTETETSRSRFLFKLDGNIWRLRFEEEQGSFRNLVGFRYIHHLLAEASGNPISALVLRGTNPKVIDGCGNNEMVLDKEAQKQYRKRLLEIEADIERAENAGTEGAAKVLGDERDQIARQLADATGLGGRDRKLGPRSAPEKAYASVHKALIRAFAKLEQADPPLPKLARHLHQNIVAESFAHAYRPEPRPDWKT